ncbi:alpha/beta hydrolase [Microbacterium sp. zg-Y818]|uniref:esterase/lipase family protein n=1 Tax=unclassified Microbacterium TaxID=2609290 RepID=UPI00214B248A|nr:MULTISPECIES: alpha/beta hydrolase [unclassified Microbacterium]MCR2799432.1 alpha/beta hydrolase [Microbacterium sp. zg.Y818]WIM21431.1 alpha/beta hydrolase [Microbacterium sp. zg-Y818]
MIDAAKAAAWWVRDYAYASAWQIRALFNRTHPESFLSGERTPVVVLPGIYETWKFLQPLVAAIHERGHPVHVLDALHRNERPVVEAAEQVTAYLTEQNLHDVIIVAHSKGGLIGKQVMIGPSADRVRSMLAVSTPFGGSRYALLMLPPTLRIFSPMDATIVALARQETVNSRIVSVYGRFDPHIPGGSELAGAKNVKLETGGHFRILAHPRVLAEFTLLARAR